MFAHPFAREIRSAGSSWNAAMPSRSSHTETPSGSPSALHCATADRPLYWAGAVPKVTGMNAIPASRRYPRRVAFIAPRYPTKHVTPSSARAFACSGVPALEK